MGTGKLALGPLDIAVVDIINAKRAGKTDSEVYKAAKISRGRFEAVFVRKERPPVVGEIERIARTLGVKASEIVSEAESAVSGYVVPAVNKPSADALLRKHRKNRMPYGGPNEPGPGDPGYNDGP